nr:envelope glycoprotein [Human immunodeficiency virus 1]
MRVKETQMNWPNL